MDCKGHTGMVMTMGKGASMSFSRGQKLNARSSTEAELIGQSQTFYGEDFFGRSGIHD